MSTSAKDPQPNDIALEQATPDQVEKLEEQSEATGNEQDADKPH